MTDIRSPIPASFQDGIVQCVLPSRDPAGRVAFAFETADGHVMRIALAKEEAETLVRLLIDYANVDAGRQSPRSELMPSLPRSVPSEGDIA